MPGLIVTQHSGEGKANQYFLRAFNLDHGTDLAVAVDEMPVNMPSHAHGQGYADLNFLIPELVADLHYQKGAYYADECGFATAGSVRVDLVNRVAGGDLLAAAEFYRNDGPFDVPDDYHGINGVVRYSRGDSKDFLAVTDPLGCDTGRRRAGIVPVPPAPRWASRAPSRRGGAAPLTFSRSS